jgi:hypothetical protein
MVAACAATSSKSAKSGWVPATAVAHSSGVTWTSPAPAARPAAWLSCSGLIATTVASGPNASAGSSPDARSDSASSAADDDSADDDSEDDSGADELLASVSEPSSPPQAVRTTVAVRVAAARTSRGRRRWRTGVGMPTKLDLPVRPWHG